MASRTPCEQQPHHLEPLEPDLDGRWAGEILLEDSTDGPKADRWGWVRHLAPVLPRIRHLPVLGAEIGIVAITVARIQSPTGASTWELVAAIAALLAIGALGYRAPPGDLNHARPEGRPRPDVLGPAQAHARPGG